MRIIFTETFSMLLFRPKEKDDNNDYRGMSPSFILPWNGIVQL